MEGAAIAVADTGPLIALHAVGMFGVLPARFREVVVPLAVWYELNALPDAPEPRAVAALECVRLLPDIPVPEAFGRLGLGEQQALTRGLLSPRSVLLLDDRAARNAARSHGLPCVGTVGLIALAKQHGLCVAARDCYAHLIASGFRIDVRRVNEVLADLGESALEA